MLINWQKNFNLTLYRILQPFNNLWDKSTLKTLFEKKMRYLILPAISPFPTNYFSYLIIKKNCFLAIVKCLSAN